MRCSKLDIKDQAKRINLVEFCKKVGIPLLDENSKNPKLAEHDSLVFFPDSIEGQWYRYSTQEGGDAISFVQKYYNIDFKAAIGMLLDSNVHKIDPSLNQVNNKEPFEYDTSLEVHDNSAIKRYLIKERKINKEIVNLFIDLGLIKQDNHNNVIFKWVDGGNIVGSSRQGTAKLKADKRSWKKIDSGSIGNQGFNLKIGMPQTVRFFESSIDMMSFMSLNKDKLKDTWYISMEGLKHSLFQHYVGEVLKEIEIAPKIIFCIDNDEKGYLFAEKMLSIKSPHIFVEQPKKLKDWNEELISLKTIKQHQRSTMPER